MKALPTDWEAPPTFPASGRLNPSMLDLRSKWQYPPQVKEKGIKTLKISTFKSPGSKKRFKKIELEEKERTDK